MLKVGLMIRYKPITQQHMLWDKQYTDRYINSRAFAYFILGPADYVYGDVVRVYGSHFVAVTQLKTAYPNSYTSGIDNHCSLTLFDAQIFDSEESYMNTAEPIWDSYVDDGDSLSFYYGNMIVYFPRIEVFPVDKANRIYKIIVTIKTSSSKANFYVFEYNNGTVTFDGETDGVDFSILPQTHGIRMITENFGYYDTTIGSEVSTIYDFTDPTNIHLERTLSVALVECIGEDETYKYYLAQTYISSVFNIYVVSLTKSEFNTTTISNILTDNTSGLNTTICIGIKPFDLNLVISLSQFYIDCTNMTNISRSEFTAFSPAGVYPTSSPFKTISYSKNAVYGRGLWGTTTPVMFLITVSNSLAFGIKRYDISKSLDLDISYESALNRYSADFDMYIFKSMLNSSYLSRLAIMDLSKLTLEE